MDEFALLDGQPPQTVYAAAQSLALTPEQQRRRLEIAVEVTGLGLWEWRLGGNRVSWSKRNYELFGVSPDVEMTMERYMQLVHPEDLPAVAEAYLGAHTLPGGGDLSVEHRLIAPSGEVRWILVNGRVIADGDGPKVVLGTSLDVTERRLAEERRNLLLGELAHRAKNGIAVMMAMVHQTGRTAPTVQAFESSLTERLQAMADAQDLVTATGGRPVLLSDILERTLRPFEPGRFDIEAELAGAEVAGDLAIGLALLLHEMATNAVKYGALSNAAGRVAIGRGEASAGAFALTWREVGGPGVAVGGRRGFGTRLLQSALRPQGGQVDFSFERQGFAARVEFPHQV